MNSDVSMREVGTPVKIADSTFLDTSDLAGMSEPLRPAIKTKSITNKIIQKNPFNLVKTLEVNDISGMKETMGNYEYKYVDPRKPKLRKQPWHPYKQ